MLIDGIIEKTNQEKRTDRFNWECQVHPKDEVTLFDRRTMADTADRSVRNDISTMLGKNMDEFVNEKREDWLDDN